MNFKSVIVMSAAAGIFSISACGSSPPAINAQDANLGFEATCQLSFWSGLPFPSDGGEGFDFRYSTFAAAQKQASSQANQGNDVTLSEGFTITINANVAVALVGSPVIAFFDKAGHQIGSATANAINQTVEQGQSETFQTYISGYNSPQDASCQMVGDDLSNYNG